MDLELKKFISLYIKTLVILIFMGIILPNILEYGLYILTKDTRIYDNSILVGKCIDKPQKFLYNYIYIFKLFINF